MIIKKLKRKMKFSKYKETEYLDVKEYLGWFLFGFIPLYLIELDKYTIIKDEEGEEIVKWGINETYKHILEK